MADSIITKQELIDAQKDAQTLEEVISGEPGKLVETRLGRKVYTLASVPQINTMTREEIDTVVASRAPQATTYTKTEVDSALSQKAPQSNTYTKTEVDTTFAAYVGGRKAYTTLALAQAAQSSLPANTAIEVTNDGANNGTYQWNGTTLTKSAYDPLEQAKLYSDIRFGEIAKRVEQDGQTEDLKQEVDAEGKIYARYARDGSLYLTGMNGKSVQEKFETSPEYSNTTEADLVSLEDPAGAIFLRVDSKSGLHIFGQNGSVQENMALITPKITNIRRDKRYFFIDEVQPYLSNLVASGMGFAPIPITLMPSKFTVPSSITNLKLTPPTRYIPLDSPYYKNDQVVHPYIFECIGTMRGYRYILSINPYTYEIHENPVIYGSNDLENFEMLTGFAQPLDTPPEGGFLSDTGFTYDPELGELICYWRVTRRPDDELVYTSYWCKRTKDLYTWTEKEQFFPELENGVDGLTSPAILFDPKTGLWHLWNIKQEGTVVHRTAPSLFGPWSASEVIAGASLTTPWHLEVKWCGDKMLMLINRSKSNSNYFLGISSDGTNWTFGASPMFDVQLDALYKATFIPNLDSSNNFYLDVFYTTNHTVDPDLKRRLFHVQSNTIVI